MILDEKQQLLSLFEHGDRWCRQAEARDANGVAVRFDDEAAVSWDLTGALCRLFGWPRACALFRQLERHIVGRPRSPGWPPPDPSISAMKSLQNYNDLDDTTLDALRDQIETMPVSKRQART